MFLNKKFLKLIIMSGAVMLASVFVFAAVKDDVDLRTAPVGEVCMSGSSCAAAPVAVVSGPRGAEDIYGSKCVACHGSGAAGAPKLGDQAAWAPRIAKGIDTLYVSAIKGFRSMPAMGLCMDCSDDEMQSVVDYMVEQSQ